MGRSLRKLDPLVVSRKFPTDSEELGEGRIDAIERGGWDREFFDCLRFGWTSVLNLER